MPTEHLPHLGFENIEPATAMSKNSSLPDRILPSNSLAAYRIHEPDPLLV
jgi:hypothetical protein